MNDNNQTSFALRTLVGLAAIGAVLYFMYLMSGLINNLFIAYIVAIIASPLLLWFRKKNAPNWLSFLLTLLAVAAAFLLLIAFIIYAGGQLTEALPNYADDLEELEANISETIANTGLDEGTTDMLLNLIEGKRALEAAENMDGTVAEVLANAAMIILFVVFMLVQVFTTPRLVEHEIATGNSYIQRIVNYNLDLRQYILITTAIALVTGVLDTIWFIILGIPNPLIWGVVAAILSFVPTIGFWLAAIPPTILALLEYGPETALITLIGIVLINGFADNVIKPRYIGSGVDMAPFIVIFSVVFWAIILGPVGAILGVPMTMLFRSILFEPDNRISWIVHMMGSGMQPKEIAQKVEGPGSNQDAPDM
jgi:predicted PurR-regulated permease PerM